MTAKKELPSPLVRGERARLFPVLADTSKEGRTLSIFLACLENVEEFGRAMLSELGQRIGTRSRIETYTETVLQKQDGDKSLRPDGLIIVRTSSSRWTALVEAKVGNSDLTTEQVESYLDLAKLNGVDAVITLSNQFAPLPSHHPVDLSASSRRKAALFHWSWTYVLTAASLLLTNDEVADRDQRILLNEVVRFLTHPSAGVNSFDQMPAAWSEVVSTVQAGGVIAANSAEARQIVGAWHQEMRDLSLILSRQLGRDITIRVARAHAADPAARLKTDLGKLVADRCLSATFVVPDAAAPIELCSDLQKRTLSISMKLRAPDDRKSTKARVNWLLRQIPNATAEDLHLRLFWPGRAAATQHPIAIVRDSPDVASNARPGMVASSFEVLLVKNLAGRFGQRRNFVSDLEAAVPEFYEQVGQHLRAWQPPAPKLRDERAQPADVDAAALQEQSEETALSREE